MKFFRHTHVAMLIAAAVAASSAVNPASAFYFGEDLSALESQHGIAIVYPKSIGPEAPASAEVSATTTQTPETETTSPTTSASSTETASEISTTLAPTTTTTSAAPEASTEAISAEESSSQGVSITVETKKLPAAATAGVASTHVSTNLPGDTVNRVWHFNSQGVNTESVWYAPRLNDESSAESSQAVVRVPSPTNVVAQSSSSSATAAASASASASSSSSSSSSSTNSASASSPNPTFLRRAPVLGDDFESSSANGLTKRTGEEFQDRNLYFPEISRIQSSTSTSNSAAASAASSSSSSSAFSSNNFGVKNNYNAWSGQSSQQSLSPAKAVRKVYLNKSGQRLTENERSQYFSNAHQEPVRVRVVVQSGQDQVVAEPKKVLLGRSQNEFQNQDQIVGQSRKVLLGRARNELQNNYLERLREADDRSSSAQSSQFFARKANHETSKQSTKTSNLVEEKEYVEVKAQTKTIPKPPVKSLPPPPPPAKVVQGTKTAPLKRQPVFEQQTLERLEESHPAPEPYSYNFNTDDGSGNTQFRREEGTADGVVRGSYGYTDAWGIFRIVDYIADANGYRATIRSNEPGLNQINPATNAVEEPAQIKIVAEETPSKVLELMRLTKPRNDLV